MRLLNNKIKSNQNYVKEKNNLMFLIKDAKGTLFLTFRKTYSYKIFTKKTLQRKCLIDLVYFHVHGNNENKYFHKWILGKNKKRRISENGMKVYQMIKLPRKQTNKTNV